MAATSCDEWMDEGGGTDPVRRRSRRAEARLELPMFVPALDGRTQTRNLAELDAMAAVAEAP